MAKGVTVKSLITPLVISYLVVTIASSSISEMRYALALDCSVGLTQPTLTSQFSRQLGKATVGQQFFISTEIVNWCSEFDTPYIAIIEVRRSDGVTENLSTLAGVLKGLTGKAEMSVSWVPAHIDRYTLRTFIVSNLQTPVILSRIMESNVTIADDKVMVVIPNDPDPTAQRTNFEPYLTKVILGVNNTVIWINEDAVPHHLIAEPDIPNTLDFTPVSIYPGSSFQQTFAHAGSLYYADGDRPWMHGAVYVLPRDAMNAYLDLEINGLKEVYRLDQEPIEFTVDLKGFETGCGGYQMLVERIGTSPGEQPFSYLNYAVYDCFDVAAPYRDISLHFPMSELESAYNIPINQTGTYRATVSFEAEVRSFHYSLTKEFVVIEQENVGVTE